MEWWNELTALQRLFASIAIPATLIMIVQLVLLLFGLTQDGGADGVDGADGADGVDIHADLDFDDGGDVGYDIAEDYSHDVCDHLHGNEDPHTGNTPRDMHGLKLLTLRGIIAFFAVGGWMGVAAIGWNMPIPAVFILAFCTGFLALYFVAWAIRTALRLQQSGTLVTENAIGREGTVYLTIPPLKGGKGKVHVIVQERLCEFDAFTESNRVIKTGESIIVTGVNPEGGLMVMPKDNAREGLIINN